MKNYNFRIWDPKNKYVEGHIKKYKYWSFEISFRQHTLGSFLIILNRYAEKISELTPSELVSLGKIMRKAENLILKKFKPDRFNYLQLGNGVKHLHFHGIPRYKSQRDFNGKKWIDKSYGFPPIWSKDDVSVELVKQIKTKLIKT